MTAPTLTVTVYLNTSRDDYGRPVGVIDGYDPAHSFELAAQWDTADAVPADRPATLTDLTTYAETVFHLLNVGDDPRMVETPDPRAIAYRATGHRSLSVGDLVLIGETALAVASAGYDLVPLPLSLTIGATG